MSGVPEIDGMPAQSNFFFVVHRQESLHGDKTSLSVYSGVEVDLWFGIRMAVPRDHLTRP